MARSSHEIRPVVVRVSPLTAPSERPSVSGPSRARNHGPMCDHIGVSCDVGKSVAPTTRTAVSPKDVFQVAGY